MTTITTPRHRRARPGLTAKLAPAVTSRKGLVLTGSVLSLPATAASLMASAPAYAAPGSGHSTAAKSGGSHVSASVRAAAVNQNVVYLSYGDTGSLVKVVQQRVGGLTTDGIWGPLTQARVLAFQGSKGLTQDGIVGPLTWAALGGFPGGSNTPTPTPTPSCSVSVLRYGAEGTLVQTAQQRLGGLTTDGVFGPLTLAAVKAFQYDKGIPVSGAVDAATWSALGGFPCGTSNNPVPTPNPTPVGNQTGIGAVVAIAKQYLGIPYVWGGSTPSQGFDCSGLTSYVYAQAGLYIPRTASAQQAYMRSTNNPQPGDLVFFGYPAYHVGIYLGNNMMIASPRPGQDVQIQTIWTTPSSYGTLR
ncbi:cell wall-associated NlpC family hydrolase [Rudaeicoccus suwonensis]|uniref:Cell wall-associated NlpC family hydrolase n=1 Tax=Rudaeicoccus suwonensis TaxID=657409 RepID=A0A561E3W2_9MICO|nr:cell wall-associated NlpC family hydrolase [Rudaeicoccus suwonensis]